MADSYDIGLATGMNSDDIAKAIIASPRISISGLPTVGSTLTANLSQGFGATGFQWYRDEVAISGATSSTYTLVSDDAGSSITCRVSGLYKDSSAVVVESSNAYKIGTVVLALDSLTQGDGTEERESFAWAMMQELYDNNSLAGWLYAPQGDAQSLMRDPYTSQVTVGSAFYPISAQSSDTTVMQYSMSGLGTQTLGNQLTTDSITISTSISWESADVYFLATETDSYTGTFDVVANETVTADASGQAAEIGKVTVTNAGDDQITITNSSGKTCIYFIHFKTGQTGVDIVNAGLGGRTAATFSEINSYMSLWDELLTPTEIILNGGMNDRSLSTAAEFEADMREILDKFSGYDVLIVHPAQNSDNGVGIFDDVYSQLGTENEYFDIPNLYGDYDTFVANGWMDDLIHPNTTFNRIIGSVFAQRYYS